MATRKTSRSSSRTSARPAPPDTASRRVSALVGASLVGLALLCFAWLYLHQTNPGLSFLTLPTFAHSSSSSAASDPLAAAGITLTTPAQEQKPRLTHQQALLLVNQIEPTVAARAGAVSAQYTLFSYKRANVSQPSFHDIPVWLVHYTQVTEPRPDNSADSHASRAHHDFYVFLDASSGRELLAIWL